MVFLLKRRSLQEYRIINGEMQDMHKTGDESTRGYGLRVSKIEGVRRENVGSLVRSMTSREYRPYTQHAYCITICAPFVQEAGQALLKFRMGVRLDLIRAGRRKIFWMQQAISDAVPHINALLDVGGTVFSLAM